MRRSGILMHITSLPGAYGIGTMGKQAYDFIDFLKKAGQSCWQVLPLTPTGFGDSPYQSCSTFAGNHYLIDLDMLIEEGLLKKEDLEGICWTDRECRVDFGRQYNNRLKVLHIAWSRFVPGKDYKAFCAENSSWLPDFALFMALKAQNGGKPWYEWERTLKFRRVKAIAKARRELKEEINFYSFVQYVFDRQWKALRAYAKKNHISIIGDVPIYVPRDSVEAWCSPEMFQLDKNLDPVAVAGCPPDMFSDDGQLWGNPLYNWDALAKDGYGWWIRRLSAAGKLYDVIRMDHFRGFAGYWSVPFGDATARGGKWITGPGKDFIDAVKKALPELELIVEDLGFLTQDVLDLQDQSGFPGMKVLQFAFDSREPSTYLLHNHTANSVCYTGTHDNMTTRQWLETGGKELQEYAAEYMCLTEKEGMTWGVVRAAMSSVCDLCIIPMQDLLNLGGEGRMNFPGTMTSSNWTWRAERSFASEALAQKVYGLTKLYDRLGAQKETTA